VTVRLALVDILAEDNGHGKERVHSYIVGTMYKTEKSGFGAIWGVMWGAMAIVTYEDDHLHQHGCRILRWTLH
jgi:hypothetical protein